MNTLREGETAPMPIGKYPNLSETDTVTWENLNNILQQRSSVEFNFEETSRDNNIVSQIFQFSPSGVEKLSVVDFGEFPDSDPVSPGKRVYFIGKLLNDANGTEVFLNIFTAVFD